MSAALISFVLMRRMPHQDKSLLRHKIGGARGRFMKASEPRTIPPHRRTRLRTSH